MCVKVGQCNYQHCSVIKREECAGILTGSKLKGGLSSRVFKGGEVVWAVMVRCVGGEGR